MVVSSAIWVGGCGGVLFKHRNLQGQAARKISGCSVQFQHPRDFLCKNHTFPSYKSMCFLEVLPGKQFGLLSLESS